MDKKCRLKLGWNIALSRRVMVIISISLINYSLISHSLIGKFNSIGCYLLIKPIYEHHL